MSKMAAWRNSRLAAEEASGFMSRRTVRRGGWRAYGVLLKMTQHFEARLRSLVAGAVLTAVAATLGACRCDPGVSQVDHRFQVVETSVDFRRVLEATPQTRVVTLQSISLGAVTVAATATPPFSVEPSFELGQCSRSHRSSTAIA